MPTASWWTAEWEAKQHFASLGFIWSRIRKKLGNVGIISNYFFSSFVFQDSRNMNLLANGNHFLLLSLHLGLKCLVMHRKCAKWDLQTWASKIQANYVLSNLWRQQQCQGARKDVEVGCLSGSPFPPPIYILISPTQQIFPSLEKEHVSTSP